MRRSRSILACHAGIVMRAMRAERPNSTECARRVARTVVVVAGALVALAAGTAAAFDMPPDSVLSVGGRLDYRFESARESSPFPWNYASRSVSDRSRLMLDLYTGRERYGALYLKTAATWAAPRTDLGRVRFEFEQGDYFFYRYLPNQAYELRLFTNERRYFTHEMSLPSLLNDEIITSYDNEYGVRHDGEAVDFRWTAIGAVLGDVWKESQKFYYLRAGWFGSIVQAAASYVNNTPARDSLQNHAILKGELTAVYSRLGAVLSYEQSGFDHRAFFIPSASNDCGGGYDNSSNSSLPDNAALYAELRLMRVPIKNTGLWSLIGHYQSLGDGYINNLGTIRRGETEGTVGLYYSAAKKSIDGRLEYTRWDRTRYDDKKQQRTGASVRGLLANGFEIVLRGAHTRTVDELGWTTNDGYGYAALRRYGRKVESGILFMLQNIPNDGLDERLGIEARFNFTGAVSWYGRLITSERATSSDAIFWQFEIRPTDMVYAALGYGRDYIGDEPFVLLDPDIGQRDTREAVYFVQVRGDF